MLYLLAALALLALLVAARWLLAREAILTLEDAIVLAGEDAEIRVRLELRLFLFIDPDIVGAEIELLAESGPLERARTGRDGIARFRAPRLPRGLHRIRARLAPGASHRAREAEGLVAVFEADEPVGITDIDHTVADVSPFGFVAKPNSAVRPMAGAPEALTTIAQSTRILYLSARDHIFVAKTRAWLRENGFPEGPLLLRRVRFTSATPLEHKLSRLEEVVTKLRNIRFGVGDLPTDVEAYRKRGIPPILISPRPIDGLPKDVPQVSSWSEILKRFG